MEAFLKLVAEDLFTKFGDNLQNVTLVFPTHRSSLFFNKYLASVIEKPLWLPRTKTITEIMFEVSELKSADNLQLVFSLFDVYRENMNSNESFDSFYFWGNVMLSDFDQIDKFRVNPEYLFTNIKNLKEVEEKFGGFSDEQLDAIKTFFLSFSDSNTVIKEKYFRIWNVLGSIYQSFKNKVLINKSVYEGLAYRISADKFDNDAVNLECSPIVFIGFNALNECEKALFRYSKTNLNALFYWDYDRYYTENDIHEAGTFIRQNILEFPNSLASHYFDNFKNIQAINLVQVPTAVTQAKVLPKILSKINESGEINLNTAVVLPDESLLLPVLTSIPPEVEKVNITMGYPVKESSVFALAESLIRLQVNVKESSDSTINFYYKDVLSIVNHPFIQIAENENSEIIRAKIVDNNIILLDKEILHISSLFSLIFERRRNGLEVAEYLLQIFNQISSVLISKTDTESFELRKELEFIYSIYIALNKLVDNLRSTKVEVGIKIFQQLFRKVLAQLRVSFSGEPLEGIQVMGFLETRTLDFENVIILSLNDDVLPGKSYSASFITPSLRYAYNLPDIKHLDSIYSYYFYRLMQRSKNCYLVYCNRAEGVASGELSRYAVELLYEFPNRIKQIDVKFNFGISGELPINVEANEIISEKLNQFLIESESKKFLSPSTISNYILCPFRFYLKSIAGIKEPDEVVEEIDYPNFGKIIHRAMELIYHDFDDKEIKKVDVEVLLTDIPRINKLIEDAFVEIFYKSYNRTNTNIGGRNLLFLNQIKYLIIKMIKLDINRAPFSIISQENVIESTVEISISNSIKKIKIGGFIDRLEDKSGVKVIVDYKTGDFKKKGNFKSVDQLFDPRNHKNLKDIFQIFIYSYMIQKHYPDHKVKPELWYVRHTSSDYLPQVLNDGSLVNSFKPYFDEFEKQLVNLLQDIYNPDISFNQTNNKELCKTCPYKSICGKGL